MFSSRNIVMSRNREAQRKFIDDLTTQCVDIIENVLPRALSESQWCDAGAREAFLKAKFIQESLRKIPPVYSSLVSNSILKSTNPVLVVPFLEDEASLPSLSTVGERLDIAFQQNPSLTPELKEIIHVYFLQIFGEDAFGTCQFYSALFLKYYKQNQTFISTESSPRQVMELQANLQIQLAQGPQRMSIIWKICESLSSKPSNSTFAEASFLHTTILIMLASHECDFSREIITKLRQVMRNKDGSWDEELLDLYFLSSDPILLKTTFQSLEDKEIPNLMELFVEIVNSKAVLAQPKYKYSMSELPSVYENELRRTWVICKGNNLSTFDFNHWKTVLHRSTRSVVRNEKNALEDQLEKIFLNIENLDFWRDILSSHG